MKFVTNRISVGKSGSFADFIQKVSASNPALSKTASTKEANIANFGDKKAAPFGKSTDEKEKNKTKTKTKDNEVKPSAEEEKESCSATSEKEVKVAEEKKTKDGEMRVEMQEMDPVGGSNTGKAEGEKKKKEASSKKASNSEVPAENKGVTHKVDECCGAPTSKSDDGSESSKKTEKKTDEKTEKGASSTRFVRIANLDSKTKNEWKKYFKKLYPSSYVDAMFADK
jgi:hypothetical protein